MALQPCRECQWMVSSEARICPHCGISHPARESDAPRLSPRMIVAGAALTALVLLGFVLMLRSGRESAPAPRVAAVSPAPSLTPAPAPAATPAAPQEAAPRPSPALTQPQPPSAPPPAGTGSASGHVRICTTRAADSDPLFRSVSLPQHAVFSDGGRLTGDLRDPWNPVVFQPTDRSLAFVTTEPVTLTRATPCAVAGAMVLSGEGYRGTPLAAADNHVWDLDHVLGFPQGGEQPDNLSPLIAAVRVRATLLTNLSEVYQVPQQDVAADPAGDAAPDGAAAAPPAVPPLALPAPPPLPPPPPAPAAAGDRERGDAFALARALPPNGPDGHGNFQVCASHGITGLGTQSITLPARTLFDSAGRLAGDLRDPASTPTPETARYAVRTLKPVSLSRRRPCTVTTARVVVSRRAGWTEPLVRASDHLRFLARARSEGDVNAPPLPSTLQAVLDLAIVNGTPVSDIGHPEVVD